jgi:UDP-glucuronate decarboxylase
MINFDEKSIISLNSRINVNRFENTKILITGGSGMVGSYLANSINALLELNGKHPAKMLLTSRNGDFSNIVPRNKKNLSFYSGPFNNFSLENGFDFVFHTASPASPTKYSNPTEIFEANLIPLEIIAKSQTNLRELFFVSAGETYGTALAGEVTLEDVALNNMPPIRMHYPSAKLQAEESVKKIAQDLGFRYRIIKLFHCFGPGMRENDGRSFADFIWAVARGKTPELKTSGTDVRTFLYLEDVIAGFLIENLSGDNITYNLGGSFPISIFDFAKKIMKIGGIQGEPLWKVNTGSYVSSPHSKIMPNCEWLISNGWHELVSLDEAILKSLNSIKTSIKN